MVAEAEEYQGFVNSDMLDAALEWLARAADTLCICKEEPDSYSSAVDNALAKIAVNWDTFEEPQDWGFGRILIVLEVTGTGLKDGTAEWVALAGGSKLLFTVPCEPVEVIKDAPLAVREWCISIECVEGGCELE